MLHEPSADALRDPEIFQAEVMARCEPAVLRGAARDWPMLSGATTPSAALDGVVAQLRRFDSGKLAEVFVGKPEIGARYTYDATLAGFNFERSSVPFGEALTRILDSAADPGRTSMYMGSMTAETYFPGIEETTRLPFVPPAVRPRFWVGHASTVACHYDTMDNVACVAAGRRRFTLFPPDAIRDLYVGPIDHTLAGQPISLAVGSEPGDPRFPASKTPATARWSSSSSPAMRSTCRNSGGIRSRRSATSTSWSISGGTGSAQARTSPTPRCCYRC